MDVQFFGANCLKLSNKKATLVFDDNLGDVGLAPVTRPGDISLFTGPHGEPPADARLVIDYPGEYEVSNVSIRGVAARGHMDEAGKNSVIYKVVLEDVRVAVLGHIYPDLSERQLEEIGMVDVLFVPVGGNGYTLDAAGALGLIKKIEPKLVIPTHYADGKIAYPVPQQDLEAALKNMSMEPKETVPKLKLKAGELGDVTQLIVLDRS